MSLLLVRAWLTALEEALQPLKESRRMASCGSGDLLRLFDRMPSVDEANDLQNLSIFREATESFFGEQQYAVVFDFKDST
jgi:hypothetical protein